MDFLFLPALSAPPSRWAPAGPASNQYVGKISKAALKNPLHEVSLLNWMDEELQQSNAYYPHLLLSYFYFRNVALQLPDDGYVFGDSGGFSVMRYGQGRARAVYFYDPWKKTCSNILKGSGGAEHQRCVAPVDVVRWQANLASCDAGVVLDMPPVTLEGKNVWTVALQETLKNIRAALPYYERLRDSGGEFKWWGVAHGWTQEELDMWWREVSAIYPFTEEGEGWAFKARDPSYSPEAIARCLYFIKTRRIKRAHFLAAAKPVGIATLLVLGPEAGLEFVTSDAESAGLLARNRKIICQSEYGMRYTYVEEKGEGREVRDWLLQCPCASCTQIEGDAKRWVAQLGDVEGGEYNEYWTFRFHFHNVLAHVSMVAALQSAAEEDPDALLREVLGKKYSTVLRSAEGRESTQMSTGVPRSMLEGL